MNCPKRWVLIAFALAAAGTGQIAFCDAPRKISVGAGQAPIAPSAATGDAHRVVMVDAAAIPARYSAPLPQSVEGLKGWMRGAVEGPPRTHAIDNLLNGNVQWLGRLKAASAAIPESDHLAWGLAWQAIFDFKTPGPAFCAAAREVMAGPPGAMRLALVGTFARNCAKPQDRALMLRADTPNWAVLAYFDPWLEETNAPRPAYDPRLVAAAREIILAPPPAAKPHPATHTDSRGGVAFEMDLFGPSENPRSAAFTLTSQRNPQADEALLKIHAEIKDRKVADEVALAFLRTHNQKGKALAMAACKRIPEDPVCENTSLMEDPGKYAAQDPSPVDVEKIGKRIAQLRALGFQKVEQLPAASAETDDATELLLLAGYGTSFDTETDKYPNEHDSLMRTLAQLVKPALEDAVFEERAPGIEDESTPYRLTVYAGGKRFSTLARNLGDWYDVDAVLDLLNHALADQKVDLRYTALDTGDQTLIVLAAPPAAVAKAVKAGLIEVGDPKQAEKLGKEFEDRVIESIRKGE